MSAWRTLILIFIFAAAVRFYALGRACFWYDEFGSLEASTGRGLAQLQLPVNRIIEHPTDLTSLSGAPPIWQIWTSLDLDNHPPLYFFVLRMTRDLLGDAEWAARLPSVIFSLLALLFFYLIVRMQLRELPALAATFLLGVAGSQITLAQEARPYAIWLALSLICGWIVLRFTPSPGTPGEGGGEGTSAFSVQRSAFPECPHPNPLPEYRSRGQSQTVLMSIILCLIALASLLTHYLAVPILLSLFIYATIRLKNRSRIFVMASIATATIIFTALWGPFFLRQLHSAGANNAWQYDDNSHHFLHMIWHLMQLPARWLSEPGADFAPIAILIFAWTIFAMIRCRRQPGFFFWMLWSVPLISLIAATDILRHAQSLLFMRYTFAAAPALCYLAGAFMQSHRHGWLAPAALGVLCLSTLPDVYSKVMDWRNVAADLRENVRSGDTIIFTPGPNPVSWSQSSFLGIWHYAPSLPASILILTDENASALQQALRPQHATWVICFDPTLPPNALDPAATIIRTGVAPSMGRVSELAP